MANLEILEKLTALQIEIEYGIESGLSEDEITELKKQFNNLLNSLEKHFILNEYDDPQDIIDSMIKIYKLPIDFAISKNRGREKYAYPKHKAMVICKYLFYDASKEENKNHLSLTKIASYFNKKHDSVLYAEKNIKNLCETDKRFRDEFELMQKKMLQRTPIKFNYGSN